MESRKIFDYIHFGESFWYLMNAEEGTPIKIILKELDNIFRDLDEFNLPVTRRGAYRLENLHNKLKHLEPHSDITQEQASELVNIMEELESTLLAESTGNVAFIVTDKRIDIDKLLYDVPSLLAPNVFESLADAARYDLIEAGKCIAFERPTAAAFHLMRATEGILRQLYCTCVKRQRVELMWGPMLQHLRQCKNLHFGPLIDHLDHIRYSFRNPTQHPDKIYDIQEVQDLFNLCVDVVNRMVACMEAHEPE